MDVDPFCSAHASQRWYFSALPSTIWVKWTVASF